MDIVLALAPLLVVGGGALLLMLAEALSRRRGGLALGAATILFSAAAVAASVWLAGIENLTDTDRLAPWLLVDRFSLFFDVILCLGGALAALLAGGYLPEHQLDRGEFYALLLFTTLGAMTLASAGDALTLFLGLETMSIGAYAMTAFRRGRLSECSSRTGPCVKGNHRLVREDRRYRRHADRNHQEARLRPWLRLHRG